MTKPEPFFFDTDARPLFGWLHRADRPGRLGLVVCNPFGYEAICAHRGLRAFAEAAAAVGVPALRFDYDGTGNSAGDDRDPARLAAWVASTRHAIAALRRETGVEKVALLGVRLGALVVALAADGRDDVDGLVALAPVVAGKAHLRELRALQMALSLPERPPGARVEDGVQEALGFALTASTKAELGEVDLTRLERAPAPAVLLLERDDLPANDAWPQRLEAQGAAVTRLRLPGYVELVLGAEHTVVPEKMVRATADWLSARSARHGAPASAPLGAAPAGSATFGPVVETATFVDPERRLFGILSTPASPPPARRGLLLLNAGAIHHVGPNRLHVTLARRWAALGHAVLRLDVSGIGDSRARPGERENVVYGASAGEDVRRGLDFLRAQPGVVDVHAVGLCSGGYHAFKAAVAGVPMDGVVLINPLTFFFDPEEHANKDGEAATTGETTRYLRRLRDPAAWKKLLSNGVDLRRPAQTLARFAADRLRGHAQELARRVGVQLGDDLGAELTKVAARGTAIRFVFSADDPGQDLLRVNGGSTVDELRERGRLDIVVIAGTDHTFTPLWSHAVLTSALAAHFDSLPRARA
jgi:pimeloyl-ACP methyl ester carboxylesterase